MAGGADTYRVTAEEPYRVAEDVSPFAGRTIRVTVVYRSSVEG